MKTLAWIGFLATLSVCPVWAQDDADPGVTRERVELDRTRGPMNRVTLMARRLAAQLQLTEEQREQYDSLVEEYAAKVDTSDTPADRTALIEEMRVAREAGDQERVRELMEQIRSRQDSARGALEEFYTAVEPILTEEQKGKLATFRAGRREDRLSRFGGGVGQLNGLREQLGLDADQQAEFDRMMEELRGKMRGDGDMSALAPLIEELRKAQEAGDTAKVEELRGQFAQHRPDREALVDQFYEDLEQILRPEQIAKLGEIRERDEANRPASSGDARGILRAAKRLDLTEEQKADLREIEDEVRAASRDVRDRAARAALADKTKADILAILTPEQTQAFEQALSRADRPRPNRARDDAEPGVERTPRPR